MTLQRRRGENHQDRRLHQPIEGCAVQGQSFNALVGRALVQDIVIYSWRQYGQLAGCCQGAARDGSGAAWLKKTKGKGKSRPLDAVDGGLVK